MQNDGMQNNIWANRFTTSGGWETAQPVEDSSEAAEKPSIAIDSNGNALALWNEFDGVAFNIMASRFTPASGWSVARAIEINAGNAEEPQVVFDANGNAMAVWVQPSNGFRSIWANRFTVGVGWGIAQLIESQDTGHAARPSLAVEPNGNAMVVAGILNGAAADIWAIRFVPATGWGAPQLIEGNPNGAADARVAIDANGNAVAVWRQIDGPTNVWSNRFTPATGWAAAQLIEADNQGTGAETEPSINFDASGNAVAVWSMESSVPGTFNIWSNRFIPATGWGTAQLIESDNAGSNISAKVAVAPNGNAVAVWIQIVAGRSNVWVNRFTPGAGWATPQPLEFAPGWAADAQVGIDANGNAIAVWRQFDGIRFNIWSSRFTN
jgi:hypothetical protein